MKCPKCDTVNPDDSKFCKECATFLTGDGVAQPSFTKTLETPSKGIIPGTTFATRYKVIEELGRGGMGVVYKAEDAKLKRTVAIKLLPPELTGNKEAKERFIREAQSAAVLDHPNICTIFEVDESEDKTFISMAYVDGQNLREKTKAGPIDINEALNLAIQASEGLAAAQSKGIIHRDIKSANIMVTQQGQVKIMDFGLAKFAGASLITREGVIMGTVAYMSPEQAQGKAVDHRSDIWSLGVVLYELFGSQLPFQGETEASYLYSIVHEDPTPLKEINSEIPNEIQKIVSRALKKKPDERYNSAREMCSDLKQFQAQAKAEAVGLFNLHTFLGRLRRPRIAIPAVLALALIAAVAIWYFNHQARSRWAHEVALPEIVDLINNDEYIKAFNLAKKIESDLSDDEELNELWLRMSQIISIVTAPADAKIYFKVYSEDKSEYEFIGDAPIENWRIPQCPYWLRLEREGYETYENLFPGLGAYDSPEAAQKVNIELDEKGSIPDGMVRIPESTRAVELYGLHTEENFVPEYLIDKYEVTNGEFKQFVDAGGYQNPKYWEHEFEKSGVILEWQEALSEFCDRTGRPGPSTWELGTYPEGQKDYPVTGICWFEAAAFAAFSGKSLPTVFHWNNATLPAWAEYIVPLSNFDGRGPWQIGSGPVGPNGTCDMAGNVKEWCWNASEERRYILGGGWNEPTYLFYEADAQSPFDRASSFGFRCIKYLQIDDKTLAQIGRSISYPEEAYKKNEPASDAVYQALRSQFAYDAKALEAVIEGTDNSSPYWIRERITFRAAYGNERVVAYLFLPRNIDPPYQTVAYFPGASARWQSAEELQIKIIDFLIRSGRAVLYPIYKGTHDRSEAIQFKVPGETREYAEYVIFWINDLRRSIDYLQTRNDIDMNKIAYYGFSWGARTGSFALALEERFSLGILLDGGLPVFVQPRPEVDEVNYLPRIQIPVLMVNGENDFDFPIRISQQPMFNLLGTPNEHKRHVVLEGGHGVATTSRNQVISEILNWLDTYFGQPKKSTAIPIESDPPDLHYIPAMHGETDKAIENYKKFLDL
jgi:predicted Ser/Thr protein kinase/dienelactone hydrolase